MRKQGALTSQHHGGDVAKIREQTGVRCASGTLRHKYISSVAKAEHVSKRLFLAFIFTKKDPKPDPDRYLHAGSGWRHLHASVALHLSRPTGRSRSDMKKMHQIFHPR